jgi:hypothetical protein
MGNKQRLSAAAPHAINGGPRGRALASTVSGGNRHAVNVHGVIAITIVWNAGASVCAAKRKDVPAKQKTQWSAAGPLGVSTGWVAPPSSPGADWWRHSRKPAESPAWTALAATRPAATAKAKPCSESAKTRTMATNCRPVRPNCCDRRIISVPAESRILDSASRARPCVVAQRLTRFDDQNIARAATT